MLDRPARDKHSSLFGPFISYEEKKFFSVGPWVQNDALVNNLQNGFHAKLEKEKINTLKQA
jgi:hypothetical protein